MDVLGEFPLDGAENEGWRENGFWFGGLIGCMQSGECICLEVLASGTVGTGKKETCEEWSPAGVAGVEASCISEKM